VTVVNDTTVQANLVISAIAATGARSVRITSGGVTTNAVNFTITAPTLTSMSPTAGARGTTVPVTITGTGLSSVSNVTVAGTGVSVTGVTVVNDTTVQANIVIAANATAAARSVRVVTSGGVTSNALSFGIN